jgi:hypothetical protein
LRQGGAIHPEEEKNPETQSPRRSGLLSQRAPLSGSASAGFLTSRAALSRKRRPFACPKERPFFAGGAAPRLSFSASGQFEGTGTLQKIHDVKEPARAEVMTRALPLRRSRVARCDRIAKINFLRPAGAKMSERSLVAGALPRPSHGSGPAFSPGAIARPRTRFSN